MTALKRYLFYCDTGSLPIIRDSPWLHRTSVILYIQMYSILVKAV